MCKANDRMEKAAKELMELKAMQDELRVLTDTVTGEIRNYMGDEEDMQAGAYLVSYRSYVSFRVDTASLKKDLPDVAALCSRRVESRRFQIRA